MSDEYNKGFNDAINKIIFYCREQAENYARLYTEAPKDLKSSFSHKAIAIVDFRILIEDLFQTEVIDD
jgi:hypothetical protein